LRQAPQLIIAGGSNEGYALGTRGVLEGDLVVSGPSLHTSRPRDWTNVWEGQRRILNAVIEGTRVGDHPVLGRGNTEITYEQIGFFDGKRINRTANQTANRGEATFGIRLNDMPNAHGDLLTMHVIRDIIQQELALINEGQPDHQLELTDLQKRAHIAAAVSEPERTQWIVDYVQNKVGHPLNEWVYGERGLEQAIILAGAFSNPDLADQPRRPDLIIIGPGERALYHEPDEYVKIDDLRQYAEIYGDIFSHPNFN
ncbi:MAG TPA: hypothetical protein VLF93_00235, partial [Candidatus Saccharimonadales bacterium]|nr:hypothetical protein [Candidatus Saccharimonadales bacterium]